jgi:hypothetical protein
VSSERSESAAGIEAVVGRPRRTERSERQRLIERSEEISRGRRRTDENTVERRARKHRRHRFSSSPPKGGRASLSSEGVVGRARILGRERGSSSEAVVGRTRLVCAAGIDTRERNSILAQGRDIKITPRRVKRDGAAGKDESNERLPRPSQDGQRIQICLLEERHQAEVLLDRIRVSHSVS